MFRYLRIAILLTVLVIIAGSQFLTESRLSSWQKPLWVTIYPVLAGTDNHIRPYVNSLNPGTFEDISVFVGQQAKRYGQQLETSLIIQVASPLTSLPPALPAEDSGFNVAIWSLKMRWWVWKNGRQKGIAPADVRMFVLYQEEKPISGMERSVGIQKGSYGVVNAVASRPMAARNRIIITHELLHILGASDKYNFINGQPVDPAGLADPVKSPRYPQKYAEIMSGRIATSAESWRLPSSLKSCVIGATTAAEIGLSD